jgi:hypothetical protein
MVLRSFSATLLTLLVAALLTSPATASAPWTALPSSSSAVQIDAFNGVVAWAEGRRIVVQQGGRTRRTQAVLDWPAPDASRGIDGQLDLGPDARGRVVAVYNPCGGCGPRVLDTGTMRSRPLSVHAPRGCHLGPAAIWRTRTVYDVRCRKPGSAIMVSDAGHVRRVRSMDYKGDNGSRGTYSVYRLDLRGSRILAVTDETGLNVGVWLYSAVTPCATQITGDDTEGDSPQRIVPLTPRLDANGVTWVQNLTDTPGVIASSIVAVPLASRCRVSVPSPGNWPFPPSTTLLDVMTPSGAAATSAARDGNTIFVTLLNRGAWAVPQP